MPDEELLDVAVRGRLQEPAVLEQQVRRMLVAPRSKAALVDNFVGQWLQLRPLRSAEPSETAFPDFDENLREAFLRETNLFVDSMLREDRSVVELLSANYTFVNERLARHYQIPNVRGNRFRRVTFDSDEQRGGLLGQGSLLTVTSYPNRTSPVLRGKWLLDNILGTPPPPPPPDVPPCRTAARAAKWSRCASGWNSTGRIPRAPPATRRWIRWASRSRTSTGSEPGAPPARRGGPIDATGTLPDGASVQGLRGLRELLVSRREQFVGAMTEKLLSYAIGRGLEYYDRPAVRRIVRESAPSDYRWSSLLLGVVKSAPFQMRRSRSEDARPLAQAAGRP